MAKEDKQHPIHYTVFHPNLLVRADMQMSLLERRVYTEILNYNHKEEPEQLTYYVAYEDITNSTGRDVAKNSKREFLRIAESLQQRYIYLDQEFMRDHFGKKFPASLVPFPYIEYEDKGFKITLQEYFKVILTRLDLGFIKGDIELLRSFKYIYSHSMYWLIRSNQWQKRNTITFEVVKLKEALGCEGKYKSFKDFKRWVLNPVQNEFRGTWVEFDYELIKRGRGGAVKGITIHFKTDREQEQALGLGKVFAFERILSSYGINQVEIKKIRVNVSEEKELLSGYKWNEAYVHAVVELVKQTYREKNKNKKAKKIQKFGPYLLKVLKEGWYIDKAEAFLRRQRELQGGQLDAFSETEGQNPQETRFSYEDFLELYEAHVSLNDSPMTEADYMSSLGYKKEGDFVVKIV